MDAVDKLDDLKQAIIRKYSKMLLYFTKGYMVTTDKDLLAAVQAVDDISCYNLTAARREILINYHLMKLKGNGK